MRVQIEMAEERIRELEALMEQTDIATKKELFNNALTFFEWAVKERIQGRVIASVDEAADTYKQLVAPPLEAAASNGNKPHLVEKISRR